MRSASSDGATRTWCLVAPLLTTHWKIKCSNDGEEMYASEKNPIEKDVGKVDF